MDKYKEKEWLEQQYWDEDKSQKEIARELDENSGTISYWMDKYDIETRDRIKESKRKRRKEYATFCVNNNGYELWRTSDTNGGLDSVYVARLLAVAEYGFDSVKDKEIHHKIPIPWLNTHWNLKPVTVKEHRQEHAKDHYENSHIEKEELERLYHNEKMSQNEIADYFDVTRGVIRNFMEHWDIERRGKNEGHRIKYSNN